jgi:hypothetical protein
MSGTERGVASPNDKDELCRSVIDQEMNQPTFTKESKNAWLTVDNHVVSYAFS